MAPFFQVKTLVALLAVLSSAVLATASLKGTAAITNNPIDESSSSANPSTESKSLAWMTDNDTTFDLRHQQEGRSLLFLGLSDVVDILIDFKCFVLRLLTGRSLCGISSPTTTTTFISTFTSTVRALREGDNMVQAKKEEEGEDAGTEEGNLVRGGIHEHRRAAGMLLL